MLAQDESPAPGAVSGTSRKLLRLLRKRLRQLLRATLVLAIGLAFLAGALEIWRGVSLLLLPDIGDPFDVAAFARFAFRRIGMLHFFSAKPRKGSAAGCRIFRLRLDGSLRRISGRRLRRSSATG